MGPDTPRARQAAATRERILSAAKVAFEAVGYDAAGVRDIARRAGLSTGAVFVHFADKAALYRAVFGHPPISAENGRRLLSALGFASSVIKGGEPWTDVCQTEIGDLCAEVRGA